MSPNEATWIRWQDEIRQEGRVEVKRQVTKQLEKELETIYEDDEWKQGYSEALQLAIALVAKAGE